MMFPEAREDLPEDSKLAICPVASGHRRDNNPLKAPNRPESRMLTKELNGRLAYRPFGKIQVPMGRSKRKLTAVHSGFSLNAVD